MEESKVDIGKYHKMKRRKYKRKLAIITAFFLVIGLTLIGSYYVLSKQDIITYKETSDISYGVNLKESDFYEETHLEEDMDVIASLIKNIDVVFKYNLDLSEELKYQYDYKILAEVDVKEKSKNNSIYNKEYELINKDVQEVENNKLSILETLNIDYNKYNEEVEKLLKIYDLQNTISELNIKLCLDVVNQKSGENINKQNDVAIITLPLNTNTVEITVNENIKNEQGEILKVEIKEETLQCIFGLGFIFIILGLLTLVKLEKYTSAVRSAEKMYDDELKKILFDYKSYIQTINNLLDYNDYKVVGINTFKELMGMREELQSPIMMYTEPNVRRTTFLMVNQNLLFEYVLDAKLIREKLIEMSKKNEEKKEENK